jgi:eukaryotic-like serine/threonine-protein kinase
LRRRTAFWDLTRNQPLRGAFGRGIIRVRLDHEARDMRWERLKAMWPELEPLLDRLLEQDEPDRARAVDAADSPDAADALRSLLAADRDPTGPLDTPCSLDDLVDDDAEEDSPLPPGTRIGPWVVRRTIARGGMGAVVLAERDDGQFAQRVAIKLIREGGLGRGLRERFLQERRILAALQHPHIARLLDGGVREDGSPFLVMEYVEGLPITRWCDARELDVRARLELFLQVCDAVGFAHRQLVVHRDLKPDHVLVTDAGEVKLLDFGIAKLLEDSAALEMTGTHGGVFTPAYATPEQYLGTPVTVASDEYQLALVLDELLTGSRLREGATPLQIQRAVLETDPERPSRRVARRMATESAAPASGHSSAIAAAARATTPAGLVRALTGDLDAILLKALERDPAHRYPTVGAFRRDLENVLGHRPVAARRATPAYRLRKLARRHRVGLVAGALVLASLAAGLAGVLLQGRVAARERDLARAAEHQATAINDFVVRELLEAPTPEHTLGRSVTVAEVLASASRAVEHAFTREPATEAAVRLTLARSYEALGNLEEARRHAEAAARLTAGLEPSHRLRLESRALLAELTLEDGKADVAERMLETLIADQGRGLGARDPATLRTMGLMGRVLEAQGRWAPADSTLRAALTALPAGESDWRLAVDLRTWLATVWIDQSRATGAESLLAECIAIERRHLGPDHPLVVATMRQRAAALGKDLRFAKAGAVLDSALRAAIRVYGPDHPATGDVYMSRATNSDSQLLHDSALVDEQRAAAIYRAALGPDHRKTLRAVRNEAVLLRRAGRLRESDSLYEETWRACSRTLGPDHWQTLEAMKGLASLRLDEGRSQEARALVRQVLAAYDRTAARADADASSLCDEAEYLVEVEPPDLRDPRRAVAAARRAVSMTRRQDYMALRALGFAESAAGLDAAAMTDLRDALALPDGVRSWTTEDKLVQLMVEHATPAELDRMLLARLDRERSARGGDDRYIAKTLRHLSRNAHRAGRDQDAERWAREALAQLRKTLPESQWEVGRAKAELGTLLVARGSFTEAESLLVQGFQAQEADPEVPTVDLEAARAALVRLYTSTGRAADARAWRTRVLAARILSRP